MGADDPTITPRRPPRTPFRKLVLATYAACGGLVALAAVTAFGWMRYQSVRRDATLDRLRETGAPVFMADIPVVDGPGPRAEAWLRKACALREVHADLDVHFAGADLERGLTPSELTRLEQQAALFDDHCALAREARGLDPIGVADLAAVRPDLARWDLWVAEGVQENVFGDALTTHARLHTVRGEFAEACADARTILDVAALWRTPMATRDIRTLIGFYIDYLRACEDVLRLAPTGFDADAALPLITTRPLLDALTFGVAAERARLDEQYASGPSDWRGDSLFPWDIWRVRACHHLFYVAEQRWQLGEYERLRPFIGSTRAERIGVDWSGKEPWFAVYGYHGGFEVWELGAVLDQIDEVGVHIELVRFASIAHRSGPRAAAEEAASTPDPCGMGAFDVERKDGRLRISSAARDRSNQPGCCSLVRLVGVSEFELDWRDE